MKMQYKQTEDNFRQLCVTIFAEDQTEASLYSSAQNNNNAHRAGIFRLSLCAVFVIYDSKEELFYDEKQQSICTTVHHSQILSPLTQY